MIRLKHNGCSNRQAALALGVNRNTVNGYIALFKSHNLAYEELLELDDASLEELFPSESEIKTHRYKQLSGEFTYFKKELKKPGCTLQVLWREYKEKHPDGYQYSRFCYHYDLWCDKARGSMKLDHKAGNQLFVDFTGKTLPVVDKATGEVQQMQVFVAILPCSGYTFVTATRTQTREDVVGALNQCLYFLDGVPRAIVSDNLKSAVTKAHKYQPQINKTLKDLALHYRCVIDPTRPYAPQDKAMVEGAVKLVYQRIFYPLSKHTFFSLDSLNDQIAILLEKYNDYRFSQTTSTRRQEYLSLEKNYLQALPVEAYLIKHFKRLKVQKMGYVYLSDDKHYYSVPYRHIGHYTEVQYTSANVEVYYNRQRIAMHRRDYTPGKYTTNPDHLSSSHKAYSQWSLAYFQNRARSVGPHTLEYITGMILQRAYPEVAYKQAWGIIMLTKQYPPQRVENACQRGLHHPRYGYHTIERILKNGLDKEPFEPDDGPSHIPDHKNIRGKNSFR